MPRIPTALAVLAVVLALTAGQAQAQTPVSIVAGPTISTVSADDWDTGWTTGFFVAVGTAFPIGEDLSVMPHIGYVQKGAKFTDVESEGDGSYDYIEIPILLGKSIPVGETASLGLSLGPQVAFNIHCDEDGYDCSKYDDFKKTEFGIVGGAGIGFPLSEPYSASFGVSFDFGLTNIFDTEGTYKNRVIYLWGSVGTMIGG